MIEIDGKIYRNLEEQVRKNKEDIESIDTNVTSNTNAITNISNRLDNLDLTYATDEDIQDLQSQLNTKVLNLQNQINTKVNQSALDNTNMNVSNLTEDINEVQTRLNDYASDFTQDVQDLQSQIDSRATQNMLNSTNSRVSALESTVTQLSPQVARSLKTPMSAPSSTELVAVDISNGQAMISIGDGLVIENDTLKATGGGSSGSGITIKTEVCTATSFAGVLDWILDMSSKNIYQIEVTASSSISLASVTNQYFINTDGTITFTPNGGGYFFTSFNGGKTSNITYSGGTAYITFIEGNNKYIIYLNGFGQYQIRYQSISSSNGLSIVNATYTLTNDDFSKLTFTIKYFE